ncbi:MAG: DUF5654 family protein [Candidatus ainarchaeum sp.]|jgi:cation transporter-like permease|nr:DUF5654 family protein [Candidatus ainarchaeum sp.]
MKKEVIERINVLMTSAFGLVAALAWNDAIKALFTSIFGSAGTIIAMFLYAIIVTIIVVWVTMRLSVFSEKTSELADKIVSNAKKPLKKKK